MAVYALGALFVLVLVFLDPDSYELRPGLVDGVVTGVIGIVLGWIAGKLSEDRFGRAIKEEYQSRNNLYIYGIHKHELIVWGLLAVTSLCSISVGYILRHASVVWPMVGENPTYLTGCCAFISSLCFRYAKWYESLPG